MCQNHVTAIPAANHSQQKYFKNRATYDAFYDKVVRFYRVGHKEVGEGGLEEMRGDGDAATTVS